MVASCFRAWYNRAEAGVWGLGKRQHATTTLHRTSLIVRFTPLFLAAGMVVWPGSGLGIGGGKRCHAGEAGAATIAASSTGPDSRPEGACDGNRFATTGEQVWRGADNDGPWWWSVTFAEPRSVGSILQIVGSDPDVRQQVPRDAVWQYSPDGRTWVELPETRVSNDQRLYRIHRLRQPVCTHGLRMMITSSHGPSPVLREVEWSAEITHDYQFPDWVVAVSTAEAHEGPGGLVAGREFLPLMRSCPGWTNTPAQFLWMGDFDPGFVQIEPRPLCAFLSGNFKDWCEKDRHPWRGIEALLKSGELPLWGACGGAQGLAILSEVGTEKPWDCPFCRDPANPKSPIYGHIRHLKPGRCGDYSGCLFERGTYIVRLRLPDPAFAWLPRDFAIMESHCGQIEYVPRGWLHLVENGPEGHTRIQCLRRADRPIYAAQFHIEMDGTPENSRRIMDNFLKVAVAWRDTGRWPAAFDGMESMGVPANP